MEVNPGSRNVITDPNSSGPGYIFFRIISTITLIACWAILAQVYAQYNGAGVPTPGQIIFLFIVAIIASVWSFLVLLTFLRANNVSFTIVFFDVVGMILMIVGVALLTKPAYDDCANLAAAVRYSNNPQASDGDLALLESGNYTAICKLLRAAWGLALANIVFFFLCAIGGYQISSMVADEYKRLGGPVARRTVIEEGYPVNPAVRNVTQTTRATIPVQPTAAIVVEKERKHRSKSRDHGKHKHSSSRDKRRSSSARDSGYYYDDRSSRRDSRHY